MNDNTLIEQIETLETQLQIMKEERNWYLRWIG